MTPTATLELAPAETTTPPDDDVAHLTHFDCQMDLDTLTSACGHTGLWTDAILDDQIPACPACDRSRTCPVCGATWTPA